MRFCTKCVMPDTKPDLHFDEHGVCDACRSQKAKDFDIDWEARKQEFLEVVKKHKKNKYYDCIIGVSGGKDSTYQVLSVLEMGLNPLCVCFEPTIPTEVGRQNLANLNQLGVDLIHIKRNPKVYKSMIKEAIKRVGDCEWPNHLGIFTTPAHIAVNFNIPLLIWGENSELEYGGPAASKDNACLDRKWLEEFGGLLGNRATDMLGVDGISEKDLALYFYPEDEDVQRVGVTGLFLGYYIKWDLRKILSAAQKSGFSTSDRRVETTYENFENLDCYSNHVHDYLKYVKYGFGRASDNACLDVRLGYISREEAVRLVTKYDGIPPMKAIGEFLKYTGFTREEFDAIVDSFTNKKIFQRDANGKFIKDIDGSLVRKEEYIVR